MPAKLTKPIIVPEYENQIVRLYTPTASGGVKDNAAYTLNLKTAIDTLFPGENRKAAPNVCALLGTDLFVAVNWGGGGGFKFCQMVLKFPNYLADPVKAAQQAFVFTKDGGGHVGIAFDAAGDLFVAQDGQIVRFGGTGIGYPGAAFANANHYSTKVELGSAGLASFFSNLCFDRDGNLWVTDYQNSRLVVFLAAGLNQPNTDQFRVLNNISTFGALAVATTNPTLSANVDNLFSKPEGLDFDGFGPAANLWVGNNNDTGDPEQTTLVKITPQLRAAIIAGGGPPPAANQDFFIYRMPKGGGATRPRLGGVQIDKASGWLVVNEEASNKGRAYELATIAAIPDDASGEIAIVSTSTGNGGMAMIGLGPYLADQSVDLGFEPNPTSGALWESLAISVRQDDSSPAQPLPPNQDVQGGQPCYLYVEIRNFDEAAPTRGNERLELYWAKGNTMLSWPLPWTGYRPGPFGTPPFGGVIAKNIAIPIIPKGGVRVAGPILWAWPPHPKFFPVKDGHFCLLARIVLPGLEGDGMTVAETDNLVRNVRENAHIAWRNIHMIPAEADSSAPALGVMATNFQAAPTVSRLRIEILDASGAVLAGVPGTLRIQADGESREALRCSALGRIWGEGEALLLPTGQQEIDDLPLAPGETLAFQLHYRPDPPARDFAVRVSHYARDAEGERLLGGQTFVSGQVANLAIAPARARPGLWPWLLLLALIALAALLALAAGLT